MLYISLWLMSICPSSFILVALQNAVSYLMPSQLWEKTARPHLWVSAEVDHFHILHIVMLRINPQFCEIFELVVDSGKANCVILL